MASSGMTTKNARAEQEGQVVTPVGLSTDWVNILAAGKVASQTQSGTPVNPEAFTADDHLLVEFDERDGTHIRACLGYDDAATLTADPVVLFFGRFNDDSRWEILQDAEGNVEFTLTAAESTDVTDGTLKYTKPTALIDRNGCKQVVCGVKTEMAATGGLTTTNAIVQVKPA